MSIYDCQIVYPDSSMRLVEVRIMWYRRRSLHHCGDGGMDFYVSLGARLKAFRVRAGLSQADLGARLGRSASAMKRGSGGCPPRTSSGLRSSWASRPRTCSGSPPGAPGGATPARAG